MPKRKPSEELVLDSLDREEPEVHMTDPMPKGYRFVPKGDVYITKHCRKKTLDAGKTLYVVLDKKDKPIGLRCPAYIPQTSPRPKRCNSHAARRGRAKARRRHRRRLWRGHSQPVPQHTKSRRPTHPEALAQEALQTGRPDRQSGAAKPGQARRAGAHTARAHRLRQEARAGRVARRCEGAGLGEAEYHCKAVERASAEAGRSGRGECGGREEYGEEGAKEGAPANRAKASRAVNKVVLGTAARTVVTRRMSVGGVNGLEEDVDGAGDVFSRDEDSSDYDSDELTGELVF